MFHFKGLLLLTIHNFFLDVLGIPTAELQQLVMMNLSKAIAVSCDSTGHPLTTSGIREKKQNVPTYVSQVAKRTFL